MIEKLFWLGHASFKIKGNSKIIYIDPWKLKGSPEPADIILIGHSHFDHLSLPDVEKIQKPATVIITTADCASQIKGDVRIAKPGDCIKVDDITIEAVPAYNTDKAFHPKANNWIGFIVNVDGERLYYASDTDIIPEMGQLKNIDVALIPAGGTYTMDIHQAAKAAEMIKPKIAVPYHYGDIVGAADEGKKFADIYSGKSHILTPLA